MNTIFENNKRVKEILLRHQEFYSLEIDSFKKKYMISEDFGYLEKVRNIVDKFTVITHKMIANELYNLGLEKGDGAGNLTLF